MRTREDISERKPQAKSDTPPLITKKEMEAKAGKTGTEGLVRQPATKKQKVALAKAIEMKPRDSVLKPIKNHNNNPQNDLATRIKAKAVKRPEKVVSKSKGKEKDQPNGDQVMSDPDRKARKYLYLIRMILSLIQNATQQVSKTAKLAVARTQPSRRSRLIPPDQRRSIPTRRTTIQTRCQDHSMISI
jgi:hypothetical protein